VARVGDRISFLVTSAGIDAATVREVELRRRGPITKWSYVPAFLAALRRYSPPHLAVEVDGEVLPGSFGLVLVSNVGLYGGVMRLDPEARIDDGLFEVYLFPTGSIAELAAAFVRGALHHLPGGAVTRVRGRRVRIESEEPVPYQVDGDGGALLPLLLEVGAERYRVIVP
jgi:diacylglycerol kinase (ATP)